MGKDDKRSRKYRPLRIWSFLGILFGSIIIFLALLVMLIVFYGFSFYNSNMRAISNMGHIILAACDENVLKGIRDETIRIHNKYEENLENSEWRDFIIRTGVFDSIKTPEYEKIQRMLEEFMQDGHLGTMLLTAVHEDDGDTIVMFDTDTSEKRHLLGDVLEREGTGQYEDTDGHFDFITFNQEEGNGLMAVCSIPIYLDQSEGTEEDLLGWLSIDYSMKNVISGIMKFVLDFSTGAIMLGGIFSYLASFFLDKKVIKPIVRLADAANEYIKRDSRDNGGEPVFKPLNLYTGNEIEWLWQTMSKMEDSIDQSIDEIRNMTAEQERVSTELNVATGIQSQLLPRIFPPFPDRKEFDIYATMDTAREVGGDFYDFFLIDDDHLALVIADVSGKGVPAALFMMISKTIIKNLAQKGNYSGPGEILYHANNALAEGNDAMIFVTVWLGILTISTGHLVSANAGHEFPAYFSAAREGNAGCCAASDEEGTLQAGDASSADKGFSLVKDVHGPGLAIFEGETFEEHEFELKRGDKLFLYTDGLPEAMNSSEELFGTERMLASLNRQEASSVTDLLEGVKQDVKAFVGDAPAFDDLTMLVLEYQNA